MTSAIEHVIGNCMFASFPILTAAVAGGAIGILVLILIIMLVVWGVQIALRGGVVGIILLILLLLLLF